MSTEKNIPNERLRNMRLKHWWNKKDLSYALWEKFNYSATSSTIGRWERGETTPSLKYQQALCALFHVDAETLGFIGVAKDQETLSDEPVGKSKPNRKLKYQRELRGWSQAEVARRIGTSALAVGRWERGEVFPTPFYRKQLCTLFEVDAEILGFIGIVEETESSPEAVNKEKPMNELKRQRELRGWSQAEVANEIGTYPVNISRWERGEGLPAFEFQQKLCHLFKKSAEELGFVGE